MSKPKKQQLKSKWYNARWFIPAQKKESPYLRRYFTEPVTRSPNGTEYRRDAKGIWHVVEKGRAHAA